jgi:hypothetical protein
MIGPEPRALMQSLERAATLAAQESGLAIAVTSRRDGTPRASVVNAGVVDHPITAEPVVGFVSRGVAGKLIDLRRRPHATVVFRSGWEWVAVEGATELAGPDDQLEGFTGDALSLIRTIYAAAVGGTPDEWSRLNETFAAERHTAVLLHADRVYPTVESEAATG